MLYGYLVCSMATFLTRRLKHFNAQDETDSQWLSHATVPEYYDAFEVLAVRGSLAGRHAENLIKQAGATLRAEMFRVGNYSLRRP